MEILTFSSKNSGGGSIIKLIELITGLAEKGWNIDYISPKDFEDYKNINHYSIIDIPRLAGYFYVVQITLISLYLIVIKRKKIDRILAFSLLEGFVACFIKLFSRRTKVIVSLRADWYPGILLNNWSTLYKKYYVSLFFKFESFVFKNSDLIIFVSKELQNRITHRTKIDVRKTKIIYNSIISPRTVNLSSVDCIKFEEEVIIGFVGNLYAKDKGVEVLIRAFKKVSNNVENVRLILVGDGPDAAYLQQLCKKLEISSKVLFTGSLNNPFPYIKSFHILVHPSLHEGFSGVILEGLYCDKVVIGSKIGSIKEALLYNELLFDPLKSDELAAKISYLLGEESYKKALNLCKSRKNIFSFNWVQKMEDLIMNPN